MRWGRTYESYSQDPAIVARLGAAYIEGLHGPDITDPSSVQATANSFGETPYAEGVGDSSDLALPGLDVLDSLSGRCGRIVLVIMSGRPVIVTDALGKVDTAVAAWLPGTAGEDRVRSYDVM